LRILNKIKIFGTTNKTKMALPVGLDYNSSIKSTSAVANTYQLQVEPTNAREFNMSSQIILQVPTRARCYADLASSKISFDVVNADGHSVALDTQAGCVFDRVDTKIAGSVLSSIQNYGLLSNFVYDCQMSKEQRTGSFAIESGNDNGARTLTTNTGTVAADAVTTFTTVRLEGVGSARTALSSRLTPRSQCLTVFSEASFRRTGSTLSTSRVSSSLICT